MTEGICWRVALLVVMAAACDRQSPIDDPVPPDAAARYAQTMCAAAQRCGCLAEVYSGDVTACMANRSALFNAISGWSDMRFDSACFEDFLTWAASDACLPFPNADRPPPGDGICRVFKSGLGSGQRCAPASYEPLGHWFASSADHGGLTTGPCAPGFYCFAGTCVSPEDRPQAQRGESCRLSTAAHCADTDTYCARDGVCRPRVGIGDVCDMPGACSLNLVDGYCDGVSIENQAVGTCRPQHTLGEACDRDEAQPCKSSQGGTYCGSDGTCVAPWPAVCQAVADTPGRTYVEDWIDR